MKNEDFDRLKKLCDENGFKVHQTSWANGPVVTLAPKHRIEIEECTLRKDQYEDEYVFTFSLSGKPNSMNGIIDVLKTHIVEYLNR